MKLLSSLRQNYPFPPLVWYIIIETALIRIAFFMVIPFVALRMDATANVAAEWIGAVIGVGPLVATAVGFYTGHLSDLWGRRKIMIGSLLLWAAVFMLFGFAENPLFYALLLGLNGVALGVFEPISAALVADVCSAADPSGQMQKKAYHLRYFAVNVGSSLGPLIGASLLISAPLVGFGIASVVYLISAFCFSVFSTRWGVKALESNRPAVSHTFKDVLRTLGSDRALQMYIFAFLVISASVSQIDTIFPIHLKRVFGESGITLFARLISLNGVLIVVFTLPLLRWVKRFNLNSSCAVSTLVWCVGFILMAFSQLPLHYYLAMLILTAGEIVVYANGYLMVENLAPARMRGAYLSTMNIGQSGMVFGPWLGGILLEAGGSQLLFLVMAALMAVAAGAYLTAGKVKASSP